MQKWLQPRVCWAFQQTSWAGQDVAIVSEVWQGNGFQFSGQRILYYSIQVGRSEICGAWILCQTPTSASQWSRKRTEQKSHPLQDGFNILSIILRFVWFLQWELTILTAYQCDWTYTQTKWSCSTLSDCRQALIEFTSWSTKELGANYSKSQWLPLRPYGE